MKTPIYPISFTENICIHCGAEDSILYIDKYNNRTRNPIYTANRMVCNKCNREYFIHWINGKLDTMIPVCCSDSVKDEFEDDIIKYAFSTKRDIRKME